MRKKRLTLAQKRRLFREVRIKAPIRGAAGGAALALVGTLGDPLGIITGAAAGSIVSIGRAKQKACKKYGVYCK